MVVRTSWDFWGHFKDGDSLRSTFLLSPEHIFSLNRSPEHILGPYFIPEHRDFGKSYWNQALFQIWKKKTNFCVLCTPTAILGTRRKPKIQWFIGSIGINRTPAFRKAWKQFEFLEPCKQDDLPDSFLSICVLLTFAFVYWFFFVFKLFMVLRTPQRSKILSTYFTSLFLVATAVFV